MGKKWRVAIVIIAIVFSSFGCMNNQKVVEETLSADKEKENMLDSKFADETTEVADETAQQKEEDDGMEKKMALTYKGNVLLVEDNVVQVLKDFLSIANEEDLKKLEEMPLTENFFNQCVEDFPYIENVDEYKEINIEFWSIDEEGKCVSLVSFCKEKNPMDNPILAKPDHVYCIEMKVIGDQIDAMKMEFMR